MWEGRQSQFQARTDPKVSGTATGHHQIVSELSVRSERQPHIRLFDGLDDQGEVPVESAIYGCTIPQQLPD